MHINLLAENFCCAFFHHADNLLHYVEKFIKIKIRNSDSNQFSFIKWKTHFELFVIKTGRTGLFEKEWREFMSQIGYRKNATWNIIRAKRDNAETRNESTGYLIYLIKSLIMSDMRGTTWDSFLITWNQRRKTCQQSFGGIYDGNEKFMAHFEG